MTALYHYNNGYRLIDGTKLNKMVDVVNNITGNGTAQAGTFTTLSATGAATFTGAVSASAGLTSSGVRSVGISVVAAAGATQGNATAIGATQSVVRITVTASTEGVKLPTPVTGKQVQIWADTAVGVKVYPAAAGQSIGTATTATTAYALVKNTATTFMAISTTKWLVLKGN